MVGVVKLENPIRHYEWGSRTAIAEFQGRPSPAPKPEAELWIGDHPTAPSRVATGAGMQDLPDWIAAHREAVLGPVVAARYGGTLPFLVKLLAADSPLSIQVHPDADQAAAGFEHEAQGGLPPEQRSYPDPRPKREVLIAIDAFQGLCAFRADADCRAQIARSGSAALAEVAAALPPGEPVASAVFLALLGHDPDARTRVFEELRAFGDAGAPQDDERYWIARLCERYPRDAMVAAPLLLNLVSLAPGESIVLEPGTVHSYLEGVGMEVMTCSDNVIRGGLTTKHVDRDELARIARRGAAPPRIGGPIRVSADRVRYETGADEFAIEIREIAGEARIANANGAPAIWFCMEGRVALQGLGDAEVVLDKGDGALVPACVEHYQARGEGRIFAVSHPGGHAEEPANHGE